MGLKQEVADKRAAQGVLPPPKVYTISAEKRIVKKQLCDYSMLFFGEKKIGKTLVASCFPKPYFFQFETGEGDTDIYGEVMRSWTDFKGYVNAFVKDPKDYRTCVIDTAEIAYWYCLKHECKRLGIEHPTDLGYGKGWDAVKREFIETMMLLHGRGKGPLYLSHATEKEYETVEGVKERKISPSLSGSARDFLEAVVDVWAYFTYDKNGARIMQIDGNDSLAAGHRLQRHFVGIERIQMGKTPEQAYQNFVQAFNTGPGGTAAAPLAAKGGAAPNTVVRRIVT